MLYFSGRQMREKTGLRDTPANRRKLEAVRAEIDAKIKRGQFQYLEYFPDGNHAHEFQPKVVAPVTLAEYVTGTWLPRQMGRRGQLRNYRQNWRAYLSKAVGDVPLRDVTRRTIEDLRVYLQVERGLAQKTARNIISGTLGAILRDARDIDALVQGNPLEGLKWPRAEALTIDPYTAEERDTLIAYFHERNRHWYPFVYTLFWTGMRLSEATALRWGTVDTQGARIDIRRSRVLGEEGATKTRASSRTITRIPNVAAVLAAHKPLHATETDHVFVNHRGRAVQQDHFRESHWHRALRVTGIRPRPLYNTRHTYISLALSAGVNIKWLLEQCGTSMAMIERHYGRWMPGTDGDGLERFLGSHDRKRKRNSHTAG